MNIQVYLLGFILLVLEVTDYILIKYNFTL